LKPSRHTAQWIHRTYNRLLALAEGRYFEFDNVRDILAMTYKLSYNDRLINRLDERILEISDTLTFDDWFKVLVNKSMLKRRDRTVIRAACYHLLKLSDSSLFPLDKLKDCLLACAMLNVHEKNFLERLIRDAYEQVNELKDPFVVRVVFHRPIREERLCLASIDHHFDGNTSFASLRITRRVGTTVA
jgi:hypothetical protein